jgi:hypothetical protein
LADAFFQHISLTLSDDVCKITAVCHATFVGICGQSHAKAEKLNCLADMRTPKLISQYAGSARHIEAEAKKALFLRSTRLTATKI